MNHHPPAADVHQQPAPEQRKKVPLSELYGPIVVPGAKRTYSRGKLLFIMLVPLMMSLMQVSAINTALPSMQASLGASDSDIQWMISGYALTIGIVLVPSGRLGDIFGRSGAFVTGLGIFAVASLLIGLAQDPLQVNLLRILQGIGSGILSPQTTGIIQEYFKGQARAHAFGMFGLAVSASVAAGPVMSGFLIEFLGPDIGWRSSFLVLFPLGIIGVFLSFFWLPFGKERRTIGKNKDRANAEFKHFKEAHGEEVPQRKGATIDLDPFGMILLALAVLGIMVPFMVDTTRWIYLLVLGGVALMAVWVAWEKSYKRHGRFPMVDMELFKIPTFSYGTAIVSVLFLGMTSVWAVFMIFLQNALDATPLQMGMISLPNAVISGYASVWAGRYAIRKGRTIQVWSLVLYLAGLLGCIFMTYLAYRGVSFWWYIIPTLFMGAGSGAIGSANQTQTMMDVPPKSGGTAGGVLQTGQRVTTAIGIAFITAVFFAVRGEIQSDGSAHWYTGITAAFLVISVIILVDIVIAEVFRRKGTPPTNPA